MALPVSYPIATELTYEVLKLRRLRGELSTPALDSVNRRLYHLPSAFIQRERFLAEREREQRQQLGTRRHG